MAVTADANGVLKGKFTIPAGVLAGTKAVSITGDGGSQAEGAFYGQGTLVSEVLQSITRITAHHHYDPLAQTFTLPNDEQIGAVEVFVTAKGASPITVQIRETQVGFPGRVILAESTLEPGDITVNAWNRFHFVGGVRLMQNVEYALVVMCHDADGAVAIAELGKWDTTNGRWVTQQPYMVGTLLSSSNASTWTAHQDRDMAFRLLARRYTQSAKTVNLGAVSVTDATDLLIMSMADNPDTGADSDILLTLPDGSKITASDGQSVRLPSAVTGDIDVKANLCATANKSAVLHPGTQVIAGNVEVSADYVTRAIDADATGCNVRVIFDAEIPSGANVAVFLKGVDPMDEWASVSQDGTAVPLGDGVFEYQYYAASVMEARVQIKLVLTGTAAARPFVSSPRVSVT